MTATNNVLEDEGHDSPRDVVHRACGRDKTSAVEDDRPVDVFHEAVRVLAVEQPRDEREGRADEEEEREGAAAVISKDVVIAPLRNTH
jgi:hypothetical protein